MSLEHEISRGVRDGIRAHQNQQALADSGLGGYLFLLVPVFIVLGVSSFFVNGTLETMTKLVARGSHTYEPFLYVVTTWWKVVPITANDTSFLWLGIRFFFWAGATILGVGVSAGLLGAIVGGTRELKTRIGPWKMAVTFFKWSATTVILVLFTYMASAWAEEIYSKYY